MMRGGDEQMCRMSRPSTSGTKEKGEQNRTQQPCSPFSFKVLTTLALPELSRALVLEDSVVPISSLQSQDWLFLDNMELQPVSFQLTWCTEYYAGRERSLLSKRVTQPGSTLLLLVPGRCHELGP